MKATLLATLLLAATVGPAVASADEPVPEKARKLAERGRELHEKGDYTRAIVAFKEAYVLAPSPGLLFNLAQAYRLQGNCDDAVLMYRRYIATAQSPEGRALAESHLATVERCMQKRNLNLPMDESMAYLSVQPPPNAAQTLLVETSSGGSTRGPSTVRRDVGIGLAIGGAVALTAAAYYGVRAYSASKDVEQLYAEGAKWKDIEPIHLRGERAETRGRWLAVGGGVAAAAGVTLFVLGRRADRPLPLTVAPSGRGARVGLAWAF